jgi:quinol monooxygenase YgiN
MYIVQVHIRVKEDQIEEFIKATKENAAYSKKEEGIARFDFLQDINDPTKFILMEAYRTDQDPAKHKETTHYKVWRNRVENMMVEPRQSVRFINIYPEDNGWD